MYPFDNAQSTDQFDPNLLLRQNAQGAQAVQSQQLLSNNGLVQSPTATALASLSGGNTTTPGATPGLFGQAFGWLGDNSQGIGSLLQGIGALGSLYGTNQQLGLAKDQLNFQKDSYNTNLTNQISSYNTNLEDKIRGRYSTADQSESQVQDYLNKNKLSK